MEQATDNRLKTGFVSGEPLPDTPGRDPEHDDQLGYAPFAKHLARAVARVTPTNGLVIGLYGPWGAGKTTVLNFVEYYLARERVTGTGPPTVVRFNPWWFSNSEDLIRAFFDQLLTQLKGSIARHARSTLRGLEPLIRTLLSVTEQSSNSLSLWAKLYLAFYSRFSDGKKKTVAELKTEIAKKLQKATNKILVIVDDIDRLSSSDVRQVFRLIKSVADFPNVTYLLAFDREAVCRMLEPVQEGLGEQYLGKIVQIPFELTIPDRAALHHMLFRRLNAILAATPDPLFDKTRWEEMFSEGIGRLPETPRDVVRFTNALALTYGPVCEEVDAVDFVAIEAIRVFLPSAYEVIRRNPLMFCEPSWRTIAQPTDKDSKKFHDGWFEGLCSDGSIKEPHREALRDMVGILFPRVGKLWTHPLLGRGSGKLNATQRRICDPDAFPIYFALSVPETSVSRVEVLAFFDTGEQALTQALTAQCNTQKPYGISQARATLEVLPDFAKNLSPEQGKLLTTALLRAGDEILKSDRGKGLLLPSQEWLFVAAIKAGLANIPSGERAAALTTAIRESNAVGAIVLTIEFLGREHGKYGNKGEREQGPLLSEKEIDTLELEGLAKIQTAAGSDALLNSPELLNTLINWQRWQKWEPDQVTQWVSAASRSPKSLAKLLEGLLREANENGHVILYIDPEWLRQFVEPSSVIDAVRSLACEPWLTKNEQTAVEAFIRGYEAREKGRDPLW